MSYRKLWIALVLVLVVSFAVLGGVGIKVLNSAPPIPAQVVTSDGRVLFSNHRLRDYATSVVTGSSAFADDDGKPI